VNEVPPEPFEAKARERALAAALPVAEKLRRVEKLREAARAAKRPGRRRGPSGSPPGTGQLGPPTPTTPYPEGDGEGALRIEESAPVHFGGRHAARGVGYECRVAAWWAVRMLANSHGTVWGGLWGTDLSSITLQTPDRVDDVVVTLGGRRKGRIHASAKDLTCPVRLSASDRNFSVTFQAFAQLYHDSRAVGAPEVELVWTTPTSSGIALTRDLRDALEQFRKKAPEESLDSFLNSRADRHRKALEAVLNVARECWGGMSGKPPPGITEGFLRCTRIQVLDLGAGVPLDTGSEELVRSSVVRNPGDAPAFLERLLGYFHQCDEDGVSTTAPSLREDAKSWGLPLQGPVDLAPDRGYWQRRTRESLAELQSHAQLPFSTDQGGPYRMRRDREVEELTDLLAAGNRLLIGPPGAGKSGLIHLTAERFERLGKPFILLLADEEEMLEIEGLPSAPGLREPHPLDEVLASWPAPEGGVVLIDALDALRDDAVQKRWRRFLRRMIEGGSGWHVLASIREFDLMYGDEWARLFPGQGVPGHESPSFPTVAHYRAAPWAESELALLAAERPVIASWIAGLRSRRDGSLGELLPFHLRLVADLLSSGAPPERLDAAGLSGPILEAYWNRRLDPRECVEGLTEVLEAICRLMVKRRTLRASLQELPPGPCRETAIHELRRRGLLAAPILQIGLPRGVDVLQFAHHLLHDFAIARVLVPKTPEALIDFLARERTFPVFYSQSYRFALEEIWDRSRDDYWDLMRRIADADRAAIRPLVRFLGPTVAARLASCASDTEPLERQIRSAPPGSTCSLARILDDLCSALEEAGEQRWVTGAGAWGPLLDTVSDELPNHPWLESSCVRMLEGLGTVEPRLSECRRLDLNRAARRLLEVHAEKPVSQGWRRGVDAACSALGRTADLAFLQTEASLRRLLEPGRIAAFPFEDLLALTACLKQLGTRGHGLALDLFRVAFDADPRQGDRQLLSSAILPVSVRASDHWRLVRARLGQFYESCPGDDPDFATEVACLAANRAASKGRTASMASVAVQAMFRFRDAECPLVVDYSCVRSPRALSTGAGILRRFEVILRDWCRNSDVPKLKRALDRLARSARSSLVWNLFLAEGAASPESLGLLLSDVLNEPGFFTEPDYSYAANQLLAALHRVGDVGTRTRLEHGILDLPRRIEEGLSSGRKPPSLKVEGVQARMLGVLHPEHVVLPEVARLREALVAAKSLPENRPPTKPEASFLPRNSDEALRSRGIDPESALTRAALDLLGKVRPLVRNEGAADASPQSGDADSIWHLAERTRDFLRVQDHRRHPLGGELWSALAEAYARLIRQASWTGEDPRWEVIRDFLLAGALDSEPTLESAVDEVCEDLGGWGIPAPRVDAAINMPRLASRCGRLDEVVLSVLRALVRDPVPIVRAQLALELPRLVRLSPAAAWGLIDEMIQVETHLAVLNDLVCALSALPAASRSEAWTRVEQISAKALARTLEPHPVFESLAAIHCFDHLATGRAEGWPLVQAFLDELPSARAGQAVGHLLFHCRNAAWLTDRRYPEARDRAWAAFGRIVTAAAGLPGFGVAVHVMTERSTEGENGGALAGEALLEDAAATLWFCWKTVSGESAPEDNPGFVCISRAEFWSHSRSLWQALTRSGHPSTAHHVLRTLLPLLAEDPVVVFGLGAGAVRHAHQRMSDGMFREAMLAEACVAFVSRAIADHRHLFAVTGNAPNASDDLLWLLDLLVESGWPVARPLIHHLDRIWR
jgi:hypothetical protein